MQTLAVVEHLDVREGGGLHGVAVAKRSPKTRAFLKLLNPLSVGALSRQLPLRLIEQTMPYSAGLARKA
jgi:hypothetical protein